MPRVGLTTDRLVEAAAELADEAGFDNVSISTSPTRSACCAARFTATACWRPAAASAHPRDVQRSWDKAIDALHMALTHWPREDDTR